ncbi:hypothetical protein [Absidia glauca]|uniref:Alpha-galactosidase n=1 Tax=Absidia glauca TaxID=4829 RepID=A0A168STB7_ABSGL|nr:hypothetical protein [Absidia glauca]
MLLFRYFTVISLLVLPIHTYDGISTPPMGWNTWNKYGCHINEQLIKDTADMIVNNGYRDAGYAYLNLDDCWQSYDRTPDGYIIVDSDAFPNGINHVADYVHGRGLKFGLYSSAGRQTCAGRMASSGFEIQDAETYANMGVDYLKYDNCNYEEGISAKVRYESMAKAINATGRRIFLSVCSWGTENTWEWASRYGHSFRTHDDIYNDWKSIVEILNVHATVVPRSGPGKWADPDMLEIGNGKLTLDESRTHFSIWAAMKAPLILGNNLNDMSRDLYDIVTNRNVIAVNQDPLGLPAKRLVHIPYDRDIWAGELVNQSMVLVLINFMDRRQTFTIDIKQYNYTGLDVTVVDLWKNETVDLKKNRYIEGQVIEPHGVAMFKLLNGTIIRQEEDIDRTTPLDHDALQLIPPAQRYEAEDLNNMVYGLARRRGCLTCSGGAQVIALGRVNSPQTGALEFRDIKLDRPGKYKLTIGYLDCYSWTTCGDRWNRRWRLGIYTTATKSRPPFTIDLKAVGKVETVGWYSLGMELPEDTLDITLENPLGYGPSIDYIELEWMDDLSGSKPALFLLPFWQSGDPLASEHMKFVRWIVDYFYEWIAVLLLVGAFGYALWMLGKYLANRRPKYLAVDSLDDIQDAIHLEGK